LSYLYTVLTFYSSAWRGVTVKFNLRYDSRYTLQNNKLTKMMNTEIEQSLKRRYATKAFDRSKAISEPDLATIQNAMRLAPSSYGIQPWHFVWVNDKTKREAIRAAAFNQPQTVDADRLLFIAVKTDLKVAITQYVEAMAKASGKSVADFAQYQGMMEGSAQRGGQTWAERQTYIALGFGLQTAAMLGVDACPMEGFDRAAVNTILDLDNKGLSAVVMVALGYGIDGGSPNQHNKFRFDKDTVTLLI
jgi:nitroreductase